jgi:hypothetical protein
MNVLAHEIAITPHGRLGTWAAKAWRRMGWRHVVLALVVQVGSAVLGPLGGVFLLPIAAGYDPLIWLLDGGWVLGGVSIVYCVLVADEAFDDGVPPLRAYGFAVLAFAAFVPVTEWVLTRRFGWYGSAAAVLNPASEWEPSILWSALELLFQGALGVSIYAYWRLTQRAMRKAHAAETEQVRNEQRLQTARLLALQSRVEPQMLFDALGRVGELHGGDPQAADALLADMIALLRAMQPSAKTDTSTVEREFALVEAWLRVTRSVRHEGARVQLQMTPEAPSVGIAPMLVLPLVRAVLALPRAGACEWRLNARVAGPRVVITLQAAAEAGNAPPALADVDLSSLRDRLAQLFGQSAQLTISPRPPSLTLDLPRLQEEHDDHDRTDR